MSNNIPAQNVSQTTTFMEEVSLGRIDSVSGRALIGTSTQIGTGSLQTVWGHDQNWIPLTSPEFIRTRLAGKHPDDSPGQPGTSSIICDCLDEFFNRISILVTTDGSDGVDVTTGLPVQVMRLNGSIGFSGGTIRGVNAGTIIIESSATQNVMGVIPTGYNRSFDGITTIPNGISAVAYVYEVLIAGTKSMSTIMYGNSPVTTPPFQSRFAIFQTPFLTGFNITRRNFSGSSSITGPFDIEVCSELDSGANGEITVNFQWTEHIDD